MGKRLAIALTIFVLAGLLIVPTFAQTALGTVTAHQLNVRTVPDPIDGVAFTRVFLNQQYTVVGRDLFANWFQIALPDGNTGWVSSAYFRVTNFGGVPVTNSDYVQGRVLSARLNLREAPTTTARSLGQISQGQVYRVLGKNGDASWFQLRLPSGITGWVAGSLLYVTEPNRVPVVNNSTSGTTTITTTTGTTTVNGLVGTVTAHQLNVRTAPDPVQGVAFTRIFRGQQYSVIGRDAVTAWYQIQLPDGNTGWVSSAYFSVGGRSAATVTNSDFVQGTVINAYLLNLRATPDPVNGRILGQISVGQTYHVVGRSNNGWYEVRLPSGFTGWVNGYYLRVSNPAAVPLK